MAPPAPPLGAVIAGTPINRKVRVRAKPPWWMGDRADRRDLGGEGTVLRGRCRAPTRP
jgi:hypothetical protein